MSRRRVHPKHLVPNFFTLANIGFGFLALLAGIEGHFERACVLLFFSGLCDMSDGLSARLLNATSKFGTELDSLSDAVSFGIVPAALIYLASLRTLGAVGVAISMLYALCGALRLARYNVDNALISEFTFLGTPIPVAASYIVSFVLVRDLLPQILIASGTVAIALLMVSRVKVPKFRKGNGLPFIALITDVSLFGVFLVHPVPLTWHIWNGFNFVLLFANYVLLIRSGRLQTAPSPNPAAPI